MGISRYSRPLGIRVEYESRVEYTSAPVGVRNHEPLQPWETIVVNGERNSAQVLTSLSLLSPVVNAEF